VNRNGGKSCPQRTDQQVDQVGEEARAFAFPFVADELTEPGHDEYADGDFEQTIDAEAGGQRIIDETESDETEQATQGQRFGKFPVVHPGEKQCEGEPETRLEQALRNRNAPEHGGDRPHDQRYADQMHALVGGVLVVVRIIRQQFVDAAHGLTPR